MRTSRYSMIAVLGLVITSSLMGCRYEQWQELRVGQSKAMDVQKAFKTPVEAEDRYAYAFVKDKFTKNKVMMMVNLDEEGVVNAKYYWHSVPAPPLFLWRADTWKIAMETQVDASELQEYSATPGMREEAILQYFGDILFDTSRHFDQIDEVFTISTSMRRILAMATTQYRSRGDKQTLLSEDGFTFDGGIFSNESRCRMVLETVDERHGIYLLELKGYRTRNFFKGW